MTLQEIRNAIDKFKGEFVKILLIDGEEFYGILVEAFDGNPNDPRGYHQPYVYIVKGPIQEKYNCSDINSVIG